MPARMNAKSVTCRTSATLISFSSKSPGCCSRLLPLALFTARFFLGDAECSRAGRVGSSGTRASLINTSSAVTTDRQGIMSDKPLNHAHHSEPHSPMIL